MSAIVWHVLDAVRGTAIGFGNVNPSTYQVGGVTVGIDKPTGSLVVEIAADSTSATLWMKTGTAATAWTSQGGAPSALPAQVTIGTGITLDDQGDNAGIEVGNSTRATCTPFVDWHFGKGTAQDFNVRLINDADGRLHLQFGSGASTFQVDGMISATGEIQSTSDRRAKMHVRRLTGALDLVRRLRGVRFAWRETGRESVGVIAQDVERVLPELVQRDGNRRGTRTVAYGNLTAVLIEAVKELAARVERLERERAR